MRKPVLNELLYLVDSGNRARNGIDHRECEVVSVGRKYFTVSFAYGRENNYKSEIRFVLDTWNQKTDYCQDYILYETKQGYLDFKESSKLSSEIGELFRGYDTKEFPLGVLREVAVLLGIYNDT